MKSDMGGAAAVLAAFDSAIRAGPSDGIALHAILCLAENSIAADSTRPDDVHTFYSGLTGACSYHHLRLALLQPSDILH